MQSQPDAGTQMGAPRANRPATCPFKERVELVTRHETGERVADLSREARATGRTVTD